MTFFCHKCQRRIDIDEHFECPHCHGGFVEEVSNEDERQNVNADDSMEDQHFPQGGIFYRRVSSQEPILNTFINPVNPIAPLIEGFMRAAAQQNPSASSSSQPQAPNSRPPDFMNFFNQLLSNLADDGTGAGGGTGNAHITFAFAPSDGNGGGHRRIHGNFADYAWGDQGLDQIVTLLLNQFDQSVQHESIRPEDIERLPMAMIISFLVENGIQCTTCMETFNENEEVVKLNCDHIFHHACIKPWLERRNTCPICRKVVDPKEWKNNIAPKIIDIDELD